jgi:hypothetical protein
MRVSQSVPTFWFQMEDIRIPKIKVKEYGSGHLTYEGEVSAVL